MKHIPLIKILYSSLALSCIDPQLLFAMDAPMEVSNKRTASQAGFQETDQAPKRLCLRTPAELSKLPIPELIQNAYKYDDCRDYLIQQIYHGFIKLKGINLKELLRLYSLKITIETLTPFELHLICTHNPDNILNTDAGRTLITNLQNKAQQDSSAQNTLAVLYENGFSDVLEQNLDIALELFTKAANQGFAPAQFNLGYMYSNGYGIPQDYAKAVEWYTIAANQGFAPAQNHLGYMYSNGYGIPQDYAKAVEWYTKAAIQGDAEAQSNLGFMYYKGEGVPQDYAMALKWYTEAANQGFALAQYNLGFMYYHGQGVPQDYAKAFEWYTRAAIQGDIDAQNDLGGMYFNGQGVPRDYPKAFEWYTRAAIQGDIDACNALKRIFFKKNDPLLINPMDINALTAKITTEIENFDFALKVALGETILGEEKNNPTGSHNTQGNNPGMAIPSLYSDFQCCPEYLLKIKSILNHLTSQKSMDKGFLITNLGLNHHHKDFEALSKELAIPTRLTSTQNNTLFYLSFGKNSSDYNFKYSKLFQEILDENNPEYLKMKEAVKSLEEVYVLNLRENKSKALTIQHFSSANRENPEKAQCDIKILNEIIEKNNHMLNGLKILNSSREKLIEIIENSTPLRNLAFSKNPLMKHF